MTSIMKPEVNARAKVKIAMMVDSPTLSTVPILVFPVALGFAGAVSEAA